MDKEKVLELFKTESSIDYIAGLQLLDEKKECDVRRDLKRYQQKSIAEQRKLNKKFKFTGERILIGRTSFYNAKKFVERVIYDDYMQSRKKEVQ